jgi:hypothetical protein
MRFHHRTRQGTFQIVANARGGWSIIFDGENLGNYRSPQQAVEDLASGACDWPSFGDPSRLSIPDDIGEWERS